MQIGVFGKALSKVICCARGNCCDGGGGGSSGVGGGKGVGEGEGELVKSITLLLDCPGDDGRLEGKEEPGMPTIDE
jgi:hypothetical protein